MPITVSKNEEKEEIRRGGGEMAVGPLCEQFLEHEKANLHEWTIPKSNGMFRLLYFMTKIVSAW